MRPTRTEPLMTPTPISALTVRGLVKRFATLTAVAGVDLNVPAGSIVGLLGPNGAGKSTLVECVVGLQRPQAGSIHIMGVDALAAPRRAALFLGAQLQATALQDAITAHEAVTLFRSFHDRGPTPAAVLAEVGLTAQAHTRFSRLSQGQRQSLALGLALVNDPALLVLDETTAGLDPHARLAAHAHLRQRARNGTAILLATQIIAEAEQLCDRVVIMDGGRIIAAGSPSELIVNSRLPTRLVFRTEHYFAAQRWHGSTTHENRHVTITTNSPTRVLSEIMPALAASNNKLCDIRIQHPTLEDVFRALTGRGLAETESACAV